MSSSSFTVKPSIITVLVFEIVTGACSFLAFSHLRKNEESRRYLSTNYPKALDVYYKAENFASFGQLAGSRIRRQDQSRWIGEKIGIESD